MTKLIGISGSLRKGSFNSALLRSAAGLMPEDSELVVDTIRGIPLYDGDVEAEEGIPERVAALKEAIVAADGLLLVTPEYNNSIPGVFKNAIDWLSRPDSDIKRVFGGKPVARDRRLAGQFRHHPVPECVAAGPAHAQNRLLGRGTADGVACPDRLQRGRDDRGTEDRGAASKIPRRLRRLCAARRNVPTR